MGEPIGTNAEFMKAADLITTNPLAISDYQLRVLRSTHPHFAEQAEREQAEARSRLALEAQRAQKDAQRRADEAACTLPPLAGGLREGDDLESYWARNRKRVAPVWLIEAVTGHIYDLLKQTSEKNKERNARIVELE